MKRTLSFVLALVMCCSLILSALPAANAMAMDFIWDQPGQTAPERKVSFSVLEKMAAAEDDELISVCVHLRRLSREEIEALVPMTKPSNYVNESTQEERDAWSHLEYQTRQRIYSGMSRAFIQRYLDETEAPESLPIQETPHFNCALNKSRIAALAALDEVIWINDAWMNIYLVQEPAPQEKLTGSLYEYLQTAQEDERIPVRLWLRGWRTEEYEALNPLPYPTFASTPEELAAYRSASAQASQTVYNDPYGTFVRTRLDESDEVLYQPQMAGIPLVIVKTTPAKIAALAKLRIVSQVDPAFGYDVAFPDPELPAEPDQLKKIDQRLREFMRIATHDELIPVSINLKTPATIDSNSTREEKRAAYSGLTTAFVENRLDETDEVLVRSNYSNFVMAIIPKHKIATLAALEDVTNINWVPEYNDPAYPADGGDAVFLPAENAEPLDPAVLAKISPYLLGWMNAVPDDEIIPIGLWLKAPSAEQIGISTPVGTIDSYISAKRQAMREVISGITTAFVQDHLDESDEIIMRGNYIPNIWVKVPKSKIAVLAALDAVTSVDYVGFDGQELIPTEADYSEKYSQSLKEFLEIAEDGERIPIAIRLKTLTEAEIDELVALPRPGLDSSGEEIDAYNAQRRNVLKQYYSAQTSAFADAYLDGGDEIISRSNSLPTIWVSVPKNKVKILAALDEVTSISLVDGYDAELLPTEPADPDDPEVLKKLYSDLINYMEGKADDAIIPISVSLVHPSSAEIEAMVPIAQPDVYSTVTMEEVNAYIAAKRAVGREVFSAITDAFVEDHLDENDTVRYRGRYTSTVICNVPKAKVFSLAALEEVTNIGYFPNLTLYPMWIRDESEAANKLTAELKDYMDTAADDEPVPIRVDLHMPSEEIMERIVSVPKPGEDASQEEIDAYNAAYQETWRYQVSLRTDSFVNHTLSGSEPVPVYYIGQDDATVICEVAGWRVKYLASMQEITQIDLAGNDEPAPCEHDYQAVVTAPTCTEGGYTTYTCSKCGDSYRGDETEALGHSYRAVVTPPTCTEGGYTTHTCACGESYVDSEVPALGHDYQDGVCTRCGAEDPDDTPPSEPEPDPAHGQLSSELIDYLEDKSDDYWVVISFDIKVPSMDQIVADAGLVKPDDGASVEARSAYYETEWTKRSIAYANAKLAFYDAHLVQFKSQAMRSEYFNPILWIQTQKSGVDAFVGLEEITSEIGLGLDWQSPAYDEIFASEAPDSPLRRKLSAELYLYMQGKPDDVLIPIHFHLRGLSKAEILARAQLTVPEAGAPYAEVQAYGEALSAAWKEANAEISEKFVREHLDERSNVVLSGLEMIVEVPKSQIAGLAALSEITSVIDLDLHREPYAYPADPGNPEEPVNYDALQQAIDTTEKLNLNDYTSETADAVNVALADAKQALESEFQQAVDAATEALKHAVASLKEKPAPADKYELGLLLEPAERLKEADYTPESFAAVTAALEAANAIYAKEDATQAEVDAAAAALKNAVEKLQSIAGKPDMRALAKAQADAAVYQNQTLEYTAESIHALDEACAAAQRIAEKKDVTQDEIDAAVKAIYDAIDDLKSASQFRFDDVGDSHLYYFEPVYWAVEQGITKGTGEKRFSPGDDCTRAQVVTFLWRAAGEPEPAGSKNPFRDVKEDAYYCKAVLWAVEQEITKGTSANTFSPDDTCTRAQIVTFLYRANGSPALSEETNPFLDVPAGQYYTAPVLWAVQTGVTKGKSPETFAPTATCTRAEVVTFLYRAKTGK